YHHGKAAELSVSHLCARAISRGNTVSPSWRPHLHDPPVLVAVGEHHGFRTVDVSRPVQNAESDSAHDLITFRKQINDGNLVHELDAEFPRRLCESNQTIEIDSNYLPRNHRVRVERGLFTMYLHSPALNVFENCASGIRVSADEILIVQVVAEIASVI